MAALIATTSPARAQPRNNDYYASQGTELLRMVEAYHLNQGDQKMQAKRYYAAYQDFQFILGYFPNHPRALLFMAENCEQWKSPRCNADEFFQRAIARRPDIAGTYVVYGIYLLRVNRGTEGIENLKKAIKIDPDSMNAHYNIALAYLDAKQYDLANEHAQKAYALGAQLPGLRDRLKRAGHWQPEAPAAAVGLPPAGQASTPNAAAPPRDAEPKAN